MDEGQRAFSERLAKLNRRQRSLSGGYVLKVKDDGLLVAAPARGRTGSFFQPRLAVFLLVFLWAFKGMLIAALGPGYSQSVDRLAGSTPVERAGAVVMYPDPLAQWIAGRIKTTLEQMPV